eukprot:m.255655 g.255655  ORF g.255655 m.255655 type:complete len:327 (+) comp19164_c1_seq1:96-1076(+)
MAAARHEARLAQATLAQLDQIGGQSEMLLQMTSQVAASTASNEDLRRELEELLRESAALSEMLSRESMGEALGAATDNVVADSDSDGSENEDESVGTKSGKLHKRVMEMAKTNGKRRRINELHIAYRMAGQTVFPLTPTRTGVRFDTAHGGRFFEQYYLVLELRSQAMTVFRHTLPPFVPVMELARRYLKDGSTAKDNAASSNTKRFLSVVSDYLNAFVDRREQALRVQNTLGEHLMGHVATSAPACNRTELTLASASIGSGVIGDDEDADVRVQIVYEDLASSVPTRVFVAALDDSGTKLRRLRGFDRTFLDLPLAQACRTLLKS